MRAFAKHVAARSRSLDTGEGSGNAGMTVEHLVDLLCWRQVGALGERRRCAKCEATGKGDDPHQAILP
jgi:hypothetical protein